jgi:hypothetical protein
VRSDSDRSGRREKKLDVFNITKYHVFVFDSGSSGGLAMSQESSASDGPGPAATDVWVDLFRRTMEQADPPPPGAGPAWDAVARDLFARLRPRDPAEELLVAQMLATHARAMFLARHANRQKNPQWFQLYSTHCQQATDLFRRQMLALAEYRRPRRRRRPGTFNAIRHANIAVVAPPSPEAIHVPAAPAPAEKALPPVPRRLPRAPGRRAEAPALAQEHRPADTPGQGDVEPERPEARPAQRPDE